MNDMPAALARTLAIASCIAVTASCGGGDDDSDAVTFAFRLRGQDSSEEFRVRTQSAQLIGQARAQLRVPVEQRRLFPSGSLVRGNGGHNLRWTWHFSEVQVVDAALALCDGRPSMVERDTAYWIDTVKGFCPWDAYVYAELPS